MPNIFTQLVCLKYRNLGPFGLNVMTTDDRGKFIKRKRLPAAVPKNIVPLFTPKSKNTIVTVNDEVLDVPPQKH